VLRRGGAAVVSTVPSPGRRESVAKWEGKRKKQLVSGEKGGGPDTHKKKRGNATLKPRETNNNFLTVGKRKGKSPTGERKRGKSLISAATKGRKKREHTCQQTWKRGIRITRGYGGASF